MRRRCGAPPLMWAVRRLVKPVPLGVLVWIVGLRLVRGAWLCIFDVVTCASRSYSSAAVGTRLLGCSPDRSFATDW